tara:strand:+ start:610 stop:822 length:213 start_codon:yes stop_codon:yes gene_type:complete
MSAPWARFSIEILPHNKASETELAAYIAPRAMALVIIPDKSSIQNLPINLVEKERPEITEIPGLSWGEVI